MTGVEEGYFNWLYDLVCDGKFHEDITYKKLLSALYDAEFIYFIPLDKNRVKDGIELRYRYTNCTIFLRKKKEDVDALLDKPCSILEMMVALSIRCEETIMDNPAIGDRTKQWFWEMINSLGLGGMTDEYYDEDRVQKIIFKFLYREYEPDGRGGLFYIRGCDKDLTKVEIWIQLLWYLDTIT